MSHGQGKPQNDQGNFREKSGNFVRAHGWTPWLGPQWDDTYPIVRPWKNNIEYRAMIKYVIAKIDYE